MTLTEMVNPSKNQLEAVQSGAARDYVSVNQSSNDAETSFLGRAVAEAVNIISKGVQAESSVPTANNANNANGA